MSRAKVKQMQIGSTPAGVNEMMEQLINGKKADPEVTFPKYTEIKEKLLKLAELIDIFTTGPFAQSFDYNLTELRDYGIKIREDVEASNLTPETIQENYCDFKESFAVQAAFKICERLVQFKDSLEEPNDKFVKDVILGTQLFPVTVNFDWQILWELPAMTAELKQMVIEILSALYNISYAVYKIVMSPDIDIAKFSEVLIEAICNIQKHPKMSRCSKAFNKIKNSVALLEGNFDEYYKDFVQTKNPAVIMENFVFDVANKESADVETTRQFREIIKYFKEVSREKKINDPMLNDIFSTLNDKLTLLEKVQKKPEGADDEDEEIPEPEPEPTEVEWAPPPVQPKAQRKKK